MKRKVRFNETEVEFNVGEFPRQLISSCSHWHWLLDMERAGIVAKDAPGGIGIPADYRLTMPLAFN